MMPCCFHSIVMSPAAPCNPAQKFCLIFSVVRWFCLILLKRRCRFARLPIHFRGDNAPLIQSPEMGFYRFKVGNPIDPRGCNAPEHRQSAPFVDGRIALKK